MIGNQHLCPPFEEQSRNLKKVNDLMANLDQFQPATYVSLRESQ